jgi:uncharacterized ferritin-like protein (DUF455 family)
MSTSLRACAQQLLLIPSMQDKAASVRRLQVASADLDCAKHIADVPGIPGRPALPVLVHPSQLQQRAVGTPQGHASLIHSLTHIEANAINLALDIVWRFEAMPEDFYLDWMRVAQEEALHFQLLLAHLNQLKFDYGDFPAHDGLWEMAEKTKGNLLARLALVPRTMEARGLDVTPAIRKRLVSIGDQSGAKILDIILRDEIGHVAIGNRWYKFLCAQGGLEPISSYAALAQDYDAPKLRAPFNLPARRAAGFDEAELAQLAH